MRPLNSAAEGVTKALNELQTIVSMPESFHETERVAQEALAKVDQLTSRVDQLTAQLNFHQKVLPKLLANLLPGKSAASIVAIEAATIVEMLEHEK